jgi:hypothetical protein
MRTMAASIPKWVIILIVSLLLIALFVVYKLGRKSSKAIEYGDTQLPEGGEVVGAPQGWTPDAAVSEFNSTMSDWNVTGDRCGLMEKMYNEYSDQQLILIANAFKNTLGETLRERINSRSFICQNGINWLWFGTAWDEKLVERLDRLGIP